MVVVQRVVIVPYEVWHANTMILSAAVDQGGRKKIIDVNETESVIEGQEALSSQI